MRAISVFSFETGTSTRWCLAAAALRRRVRKSAMGSVCIALLPTGFHDAGNFSLQRHTAKTDSAHLELADISARAAAAAAAVAYPHLELRFLERLGDLCCSCHLLRHPFFAKRKPEPLEQLAALLIVLRAGRHGDVHALDLVHARVIDLRKHQLLFQSQRVIPAAVERILGQTAEVAHAREHHVAQAIEKFVHLVAAQSHRAADGHALANFKIRKGMPIGCPVTLRGDQMYEFLDRLCNVVLPGVRDFRGLPQNSFDGRGNYTLGLKEQLVFPEIDYTRVDKIKGMNITMTTSAKNDEQGRELLKGLGFPFREKGVAQ